MNEHKNEHKNEHMSKLQPVMQKLYDKGIELLKIYIKKSNELGITFPIIDPEILSGTHSGFTRWYENVFKDITNGKPQLPPVKSRWNKVIQQGNFLLSQPSGGFDVSVDKDTMVLQYKKAVDIKTPLFMVITEPFTVRFLDDPNYKLLTDGTTTCGVYYNQPFVDSGYTVVEIPRRNDLKIQTEKMVLFQVNKNGNEPINIVNWHGNSTGKNNVDTLKDIIDWASENDIHYITGDSNITQKKCGLLIENAIENAMSDSYIGYKASYCDRYISKKRISMNIFYNNQINKDKPEDINIGERDGMFILKLGTKKTVSGGAANVPKNTNPLISFVTEYDKDNSPILGDHSVVNTDMNGLTLLVATGTNMDDPKIGVFGKKEWKNVDHARFKEFISIPYTREWVNIYNQWISEFDKDFLTDFKQYYSENNGYFDSNLLEFVESKPPDIAIEPPDTLQPAYTVPSLSPPKIPVNPQRGLSSRVPTSNSRYFKRGGGRKTKRNKKQKPFRKTKSTRKKKKTHRFHTSKK